MLKTLKKILAPPVFKDQEKTEIAQYLNIILYLASFLLALLIVAEDTLTSRPSIIYTTLIVVMLLMQILMRKGKVFLAAVTLITLTWIAMTFMAWKADGVRNASLIVYLVLILLASLLGKPRISLVFTFISIAALWGLALAETRGIITPSLDSPTNLARDLSVIFLLLASISYLSNTHLNKAILRSKENEEKLYARNQELSKLQNELEALVRERTAKLEENAKKLETRATQLQGISEVSQTIALVQNIDILLPKITRLISEHFDFYHIGIFLISEDKKFAVLQASNSPGGEKMLKNEHKLEIGEVGLVGRVAADGQPRIALDVGRDAAYFNNPYLPETRSEMALPLKVQDKIIGVLDIQSKYKNNFNKEDTGVFEALANQVAIAIENARLADETQAALEEAREISKQYIRQTWTQLAASKQQQGYRYTGKHVYPISNEEETDEKKNTLSIPVQLRDETIGILEISRNETAKNLDDEETLTLARTIANRFALALENARLLEETTRRAGRERLVSDITTKIRSTNDPDTMIQTALNELKQALGASKVELAIQEKPIHTKNVDN